MTAPSIPTLFGLISIVAAHPVAYLVIRTYKHYLVLKNMEDLSKKLP